MQEDYPEEKSEKRSRTISRYAFIGFVAVGAYFLIAEHRAHVIPYLPFVLLAACPLMHFFHHRGRYRLTEKDSHRVPPHSHQH